MAAHADRQHAARARSVAQQHLTFSNDQEAQPASHSAEWASQLNTSCIGGMSCSHQRPALLAVCVLLLALLAPLLCQAGLKTRPNETSRKTDTTNCEGRMQ